jgi:hypothetical protein
VAAARTLLPGVYYHHTMLGAQMHCFGWCAAVARVRKDVQSTAPFNLHIRGESGATDKILRPANNGLKGSLERRRSENADGELGPRGQGAVEL